MLRPLTLGDLPGERLLSLARFVVRQTCLEFRDTMQQWRLIEFVRTATAIIGKC